MQKERDFLLNTGMINRTVYAGIQPDDCVVWKKVQGGYQESSMCNHSCVIEVNGKPTGGNYICEASFVFAKGSLPRFVPRETIVRWTRIVAVAHALARDMFFERYFNTYCEEFHIPPSWADAIRYELTSLDKKVEVNRFGGSPEMLRDCAGIISDCKKYGLVVNLTSPGRRFMQDAQFIEDICRNPPHMLAMSFDDMDSKEIFKISKMSLGEIKNGWKKISPLHGQRQKAYEGFFTARLMQQMNVPVTIMFNVVIHPGNVNNLDNILTTITECIPGSLANPYPAQAFGSDPVCWTSESLPALHSHIINFIEGTLQGRVGITRRLHYYMALESAFRKWQHNVTRLCEFLSGIEAWDSTARPGAYRYAQIGKNMKILGLDADKLPVPGGHLGCFWNPSLGFSEHIDDLTVEQVAETMLTGMVKHGRELLTRKSNIMPRLMFDVVSTELGLPSELIPEYLNTRLEYAGF